MRSATAANPSSSVVSQYPGIGLRLGAFFIDMVLLVFFMPLLMIMFIPVGPEAGGYLALVIGLGALFAYFVITWSRGASLGMRIMGIRLEAAGTGAAPGSRRAAVRAILAVPPALALWLLLAFGFSDPPDEGYGATGMSVFVLAVVVFSIGLSARLTMLAHPEHRSLVDRIAGVTVVSAQGPQGRSIVARRRR